MPKRSIAVSMLWQVASQGVMAVLSVLSSKFVAVALSKELAGHYNSAYGYLQIFGILADFGLYAVAVREVARAHDRSKVLGALMVLRIGILCLSMAAAISIVWFLPQWRGTPFPIGVVIAAFVPAFTLLAGILRTIFQVEYRMGFVFVAETLQRVLTTALLGVFVFLGYRASADLSLYYTFLWIGGIGAFALFCVSFFSAARLVRLHLVFDRQLLLRLFSSAAPYGLAYLCMALYRQMDVVFIALLRSDFAVLNAYYGIPGRVEDMAFLIPTFLLNSLLPILSERELHGKDSSHLLGNTLFLLTLFGIVFFLFSFFWAAPLTLLLATPAYLATASHPGSDQAFMLMSGPMLFNGIILYCFYVFLAKDAWKRLTATLFCGSVLSVILNLLLVPSYGFFGAGFVSIVVHILLVLLLVPQAYFLSPFRFSRGHVRGFFMLSLPLTILLWFLAPLLTTVPRTLVGCVIATVLLVFCSYVSGIHRIVRSSMHGGYDGV